MTTSNNFFLLCENFIIDDRQRPSIINIYDSIWAEHYPATHPLLRFAINTTISGVGKTSSVDLGLTIDDSDGTQLFKLDPQPTAITPNLDEQSIGAVFEVQSVTFPDSGRYIATFTIDGKSVATNTIELKTALPPEA